MFESKFDLGSEKKGRGVGREGGDKAVLYIKLSYLDNSIKAKLL